MNTAWKRTVDATIEPVSLAEAKLQLRNPAAADDTLVLRAIKAARQQVEDYLHFGLITQTWKYTQDRFTTEIQLPMAAPLQSVIVKYYDASGVLQTLASTVYLVDTTSEPGRIVLAPAQVWPVTQADRPNAVEITYIVGETAAASVRADIVDAILLLVGDRYEFREATVVGPIATALPTGVESILAPLRVWWTAPREMEDACAP
jgi:uncharacterized phiE125 gp8 family phage protein